MALQMSWQPNLQKRKNGAPPLGLKNLGNTCYLNSVLQCLTYTPPLANFCLLGQHTRLCRKKDGEDGKKECPFCILERRISRSLSIDGTIDAPAKIESSLRLFAEHFQWGRQEDAHEFLRYVIDACHNTCLKLLQVASSDKNRVGGREANTIVKQIFGGSLLSQSNTLLDALKRFFRPEILSGSNKYSCSSCKKLSEARKQISVLEAPNVLVIQLKRFEGIYGAKINKDITFEEGLVLSSFMCKASQDPHPEYDLFGSIVHSGYSSDSGHYYAYIKDHTGRWYCCNDACVSLSTAQTVLSEKVYILFYMRSNQKPKTRLEENRRKRTSVPSDHKPKPEITPKPSENGGGHCHEKASSKTTKDNNLSLKPQMRAVNSEEEAKRDDRPQSSSSVGDSCKRKAEAGLENYKEAIAAEVSRKLRSCGWADEVQEFMRDRKRICMESADRGDRIELKKLLVEEARKVFTARIPISVRQSLIEELKLLRLGKVTLEER
ncbi:ubiquitin-specific protease 25 isoform X2 [Wolffia australiana]